MAKPKWGDLEKAPEETQKDIWEDEGDCHMERGQTGQKKEEASRGRSRARAQRRKEIMKTKSLS